VDLYSVKPIDIPTLLEAAAATGDRVVVAEDHYPAGGIGSAVLNAFNDAGHPVRVSHLAVWDLPGSGTPAELMAAEGLGLACVTGLASDCGSHRTGGNHVRLPTRFRWSRRPWAIPDLTVCDAGAAAKLGPTQPAELMSRGSGGRAHKAAAAGQRATNGTSTARKQWLEEFGRRYRVELQGPRQAEALSHLRGLAEYRRLTLLTGTRQPEISEAAVLAALLRADHHG
jgi:hypothetical protein